MKQADFDELVARLERAAAADPRAYHLKLGAFAALGYLYVLTILLLLVALVGSLVAWIVYGKGAFLALKLAIPVVVLIGLVARALWVRLEAPEGIEASRSSFRSCSRPSTKCARRRARRPHMSCCSTAPSMPRWSRCPGSGCSVGSATTCCLACP